MLPITKVPPPFPSIDPCHPVSTHGDGGPGLGEGVSGDVEGTAVLRVLVGSERWGWFRSSFSINMKAQGRPKSPRH